MNIGVPNKRRGWGIESQKKDLRCLVTAGLKVNNMTNEGSKIIDIFGFTRGHRA